MLSITPQQTSPSGQQNSGSMSPQQWVPGLHREQGPGKQTPSTEHPPSPTAPQQCSLPVQHCRAQQIQPGQQSFAFPEGHCAAQGMGTHVDPSHVVTPATHLFPQLPQLLSSLGTHADGVPTSPPSPMRQLPPQQSSPAPQTLPQAPQFARSLMVMFMHVDDRGRPKPPVMQQSPHPPQLRVTFLQPWQPQTVAVHCPVSLTAPPVHFPSQQSANSPQQTPLQQTPLQGTMGPPSFPQ